MPLQYACPEPGDIERRSFEIITEMLDAGGVAVKPEHASIVKRCIHASADFDYARNLYFSDNAVEFFHRAFSGGCALVTDTRMVMAGINKRAAGALGVEVLCFMADEDVALEAQSRRVTRALVSMEKAVRLNRPLVVAVGNAPTALMRLCEAVEREGFAPLGIVAAPVGFVHVVESKERIRQTQVPCIVACGRKGGSSIAAAVCNALLYDCAAASRSARQAPG